MASLFALQWWWRDAIIIIIITCVYFFNAYIYIYVHHGSHRVGHAIIVCVYVCLTGLSGRGLRTRPRSRVRSQMYAGFKNAHTHIHIHTINVNLLCRWCSCIWYVGLVVGFFCCCGCCCTCNCMIWRSFGFIYIYVLLLCFRARDLRLDDLSSLHKFRGSLILI